MQEKYHILSIQFINAFSLTHQNLQIRMFTHLLFFVTIIASLLSQLPFVLASGYDSYLKGTWGILFAWLLITNLKSYFEKPLWFMYVCIGLFELYCILMHGISVEEYFNLDAINLIISLLVCSTSYVYFRNHENKWTFKVLGFIILLCIFVLASYVYIDSLLGIELTERMYAFKDKNSMGQILLCGIIISYLGFTTNSKLLQWTKYAIIAFCTFVIFVMKARATIIGIPYLVFYAYCKTKNKGLKILIVSICFISIAFVLFIPEFYDILINQILLGSRDSDDLNDISSDRVEYISQALPLIPDNLFFGIGDKYLDCMPIAMILQFGIIGAMFVFSLIYKTIRNTLRFNYSISIHLATHLLLVTMLINSLFEAQPPFGPGIKCFLLWVMFGFSMAYEKNEEEYHAV